MKYYTNTLYDECFHIRDLLKGYVGVKEIYQTAGAERKLWADIFPGPNSFSGNKDFEFL